MVLADRSDVPRDFLGVPRDRLKHGKGRYQDVVLVPQPSASPNDPLNVGSRPSLFL